MLESLGWLIGPGVPLRLPAHDELVRYQLYELTRRHVHEGDLRRRILARTW